MDTISSQSISLLAPDEKLSSIRKRNRKLIIIIFFTLIILLAIIIGGIITSLVYKNNLQSRSFEYSKLAIRAYCSVSEPQYTCIHSLSSAIRLSNTTISNPNQVFKFSLETAVTRIFTVTSIMSTYESNVVESAAFKNCSSSLRDSTSQLKSSLAILRVNADVGSQQSDLTAGNTAAMEGLRSCTVELDDVHHGSEWTVVNETRERVSTVEEFLKYNQYFLVNCNIASGEFSNALADSYRESLRNPIVEYLADFSLFGLEYFVLVFLFCLMLRIY